MSFLSAGAAGASAGTAGTAGASIGGSAGMAAGGGAGASIGGSAGLGAGSAGLAASGTGDAGRAMMAGPLAMGDGFRVAPGGPSATPPSVSEAPDAPVSSWGNLVDRGEDFYKKFADATMEKLRPSNVVEAYESGDWARLAGMAAGEEDRARKRLRQLMPDMPELPQGGPPQQRGDYLSRYYRR